jgi:type IV pilus assembly protein PilM
MPKVTEQVLRKSLDFEASKYISASVEDSVVEFEILGDSEEPDRMDVLLVAAPKAMIETRMAVLENAGLEPIAIDVEAFAIYRTLVEHNPDPAILEGTIAFMDIGASHAEINLVSKGNLALTRTIPIAGSSITNALKNAENCSEDEAEQKKFEIDLNELVDAPSDAVIGPSLKVVQSLIDELLREIRRSVNFYQSQLPDGSADTAVDKLILTGGVSKLKGLVPYAARRLNIDVSIGNLDMSDTADDSSSDSKLSCEDAPLFTVAYGLAVKEFPIPIRVPAEVL